jgi:hypothetical protein
MGGEMGCVDGGLSVFESKSSKDHHEGVYGRMLQRYRAEVLLGINLKAASAVDNTA